MYLILNRKQGKAIVNNVHLAYDITEKYCNNARFYDNYNTDR